MALIYDFAYGINVQISIPQSLTYFWVKIEGLQGSSERELVSF